ncbi:hypothetical protein IFM89_001582 [Coptis chinensis]|uniref:CCHC-type domain-containing protein n=1 Tax=Coptis chinensis TaxID=261450 RepID=A0A835HZR4_9MAGN|nr:hypothetical protein IFM89_001582 [Coptis chinensis]
MFQLVNESNSTMIDHKKALPTSKDQTNYIPKENTFKASIRFHSIQTIAKYGPKKNLPKLTLKVHNVQLAETTFIHDICVLDFHSVPINMRSTVLCGCKSYGGRAGSSGCFSCGETGHSAKHCYYKGSGGDGGNYRYKGNIGEEGFIGTAYNNGDYRQLERGYTNGNWPVYTSGNWKGEHRNLERDYNHGHKHSERVCYNGKNYQGKRVESDFYSGNNGVWHSERDYNENQARENSHSEREYNDGFIGGAGAGRFNRSGVGRCCYNCGKGRSLCKRMSFILTKQ